MISNSQGVGCLGKASGCVVGGRLRTRQVDMNRTESASPKLSFIESPTGRKMHNNDVICEFIWKTLVCSAHMLLTVTVPRHKPVAL